MLIGALPVARERLQGQAMIGAIAGRRLIDPHAQAEAMLDVAGRATFVDAILATLGGAGVSEFASSWHPDSIGQLVLRRQSRPWRGMLSSIHCGLDAIHEPVEAALVWPVDHPYVKSRPSSRSSRRFARRQSDRRPDYGGRRGTRLRLARDPELHGRSLAGPRRRPRARRPARADGRRPGRRPTSTPDEYAHRYNAGAS